MKTYLLLGDPVAKSLSPAFQNAAFEAAKIDARYEARRVATEAELRAAVEAVRRGEIAGANVTIPWKREALALAEEVTAEAHEIGAANWLGVVDGKVVADNTDAEGLRRALRGEGVEVKGERCVVMGAGGAARAAIVALERDGAAEVVVGARRGAKADPRAVAIAEARAIAESAGVVVSAVPESAWSDVAPARMEGVLVDLAYARGGTAAQRWAEAHGVLATGGIGMLLNQGALSFEKWTGVPFPMDAARAALGLG